METKSYGNGTLAWLDTFGGIVSCRALGYVVSPGGDKRVVFRVLSRKNSTYPHNTIVSFLFGGLSLFPKDAVVVSYRYGNAYISVKFNFNWNGLTPYKGKL